MKIGLQLHILLISAIVTSGDISHLFLPELSFFQPPQQHQHVPFLYGRPQPPLHPTLPAVSATTEYFLPEIVINRKAKDPQHGNFIPLNHYIPPLQDNKPPSIQHDTSGSSSSMYLPPKQEENPNPIIVLDESTHHGYEYKKPTSIPRPSVDEPAAQFPPALLPPVADEPFNDQPQITTTEETSKGYHYHPPGTSYLPPPAIRESEAGIPQVRLHVQEMRCLDHLGGFFRAVLKVETFLSAVPTVENDSYDPKCDLKFSKSYLVVNIDAVDFERCGVRHCDNALCLRLRFPSIRGMRTGVDSILSLHCQTQNRVAVKTHALKMGVSNDLQARSAGVYAHGGSQNEFRTHVELLQKYPNGYTKPLEPNGIVQLGEDMLLRAHVIPGDGWNYTKLTDVSLQRISPSGHLTSSANLITSRGCVNPSMQSVCSEVPHSEPPLGHRLAFKAVMFQGMRSGDEMALSMKITGCLEQNDCHTSAHECSERTYGRQKRYSEHNNTEFSEIAKIYFRVQMPIEGVQTDKETTVGNTSNPLPHSRNKDFVISGVICFVGLLCLLGVFIHYRVKKNL